MKNLRFVGLLIFSIFCLNANSKNTPLIKKLKNNKLEKKLSLISQSTKTLNKVELLHLGKKSFSKRIELIREAQHFIYHVTPYWHDDNKGNEFYDAFVEKRNADPEINIKLIMDWSSNITVQDPLGKKIFNRIKNVFDNNVLRWNHPNWIRPWSLKIAENHIHEKMLIVDGKSLIIGGMNNGTSYYSEGPDSWHDTDILIQGPAALEGTRIFSKVYALGNYLKNYKNKTPLSKKKRVWLFQKSMFPNSEKIYFPSKNYKISKRRKKLESYIQKSVPKLIQLKKTTNFESEGKTPVRLIYDNPLFDYKLDKRGRLKKFNKTIDTVEFLLKHSNKEAVFAIPYFTLTEKFKNILLKAQKRGLKIRILTNSIISMDYFPEVIHGAMTYAYKNILKSGIEIYEWQGHERFHELEEKYNCQIPDKFWPGNTVHSKLALFDNQVSMVSSHNFNLRSEKYNSEITALVEDKFFAKKVANIFDFAFSPKTRNKEKLTCDNLELNYPQMTKLIKFSDIVHRFKRGKLFKIKVPYLLRRYL
tara:strand:- start:437 stop:2029 length:1593 start_codon:yes stop_codon:yes gene_type:complete